jgi:asparagine synthase (glutamine-hydrolysing)
VCGIVGLLGRHPALGDPAPAIQRMCRTLVARGPDAEGTYIQPELGLGHRRLAIIDLSGGVQPMQALGGQVVLVYNGEIYNHRELRAELERAGQSFETRSDTEVLLKAYLQYGTDCPRHFRGMFAFAIWDARDRSLFLVRDRLGIKPLYYALCGNSLVFGSEIKALLASGIVDRSLDPQALDDYFAFGFIRSPRSIYREIRSLLPGQSLRVRLQGGVPRLEHAQYWHIPRAVAQSPRLSWEDAKRELEQRLLEAVRLRLLSEVPLGAMLSGGVDSSAVVWAMARAQERPVQTFSIGFHEASHDEAPYAREVARHLGTQHHEEIVTASAVSSLPELVRDFDEPFADPSAIPTWCLCRMVRKHVTVCLSGDGGDELFAGYSRYRVLRRERASRSAISRRLLGLLGPFLPIEGRARNRAERAQQPELGRYYARFRNNFSPAMRKRLFGPELRNAIEMTLTDDLFQRVPLDGSEDVVTAAQLADLQGYLSDDILVKLDRTSMAHSLEARVPLLDHELLQFAQSLPLEYKLRGDQQKALLVELIRPHLPAGVLDRKKQGFSIPLSRWLKGELRERLRAAIEGPSFADPALFDARYLRRLYDLHQSGRLDLSFQLWELLVFDEWSRFNAAPGS